MIFEFMNGDLSYDPAAVVAATSANLIWVFAACALSFVGAYMQYFGAISMGFKHRTHSIPMVGNLWFFAHDTTYVVNFRHWFHDVDFWMAQAFWFALAVFAVCESVVTYQLLKYSRKEVFPGMTAVQSVASYIGLQIFTYGLFWWFLSMVKDPYYLLSFSTTVVLAPMFNIALMRSRGSRKGFSMGMLIGFVLLSAGFWLWMFMIDPYFRSPFFGMIAIGNTAVSVAGVLAFRKLPAYSPESRSTPSFA